MAGEVGSLLSKHLWLLQKIAGATLVILGLHLTGIPAIPFLNYEKRLLQPKLRNAGLLRSFLMGAAFSAGWTPCIGPVLSSILALSLSSRTATRGAFLMFVFSVGMAMPFLLIGFAFDELNPALNRIGRYVKIISIVSGVLVIIIGLLIIFDFSYLINSLVSKYLPKYY
jgi:cytochrome c-type biogenesis protein